jgi:hypothetical protein
MRSRITHAPSPVFEERKRELSRKANAMRQLLHSR